LERTQKKTSKGKMKPKENKISPDFIGDNPDEMESGTICPEVEQTKAVEKDELLKLYLKWTDGEKDIPFERSSPWDGDCVYGFVKFCIKLARIDEQKKIILNVFVEKYMFV